MYLSSLLNRLVEVPDADSFWLMRERLWKVQHLRWSDGEMAFEGRLQSTQRVSEARKGAAQGT